MKETVLIVTVLILQFVNGDPNGYYHQEYNYKTSASSYKNNELQHKTDDQGYYSKHGDLEGRTKPKVSSNSEHSEYVNPKLRDNAGYYDNAGDSSSFGRMKADSYYDGTHEGFDNLLSNDYQQAQLASSDHIGGVSSVYDSYGRSSSSSYGSSALRTLASQLQNELQQEIQSNLRRNSAAYSQNIEQLETELRRNVTERLQQALAQRYGQQSIRGGQSYSITDGRLQAVPNYQQQDLVDMQRLLENNLLDQLRRDYNYRYSQNRHQENYVSYERTTTYRPIYPNIQPLQVVYSNAHEQRNSEYERSSNVRYPVSNPESITTIASRVQNNLDSQLNRLLEEAQNKYFSTHSTYSPENVDYALERLRNEVRNNITYHLDEELRRQYGNQIQRNGYMYTVGSNGQYNTQSNYDANDLNNLKKQIENNLLTKLNRDFETYRTRWQSRQSQAYQQNRESGYAYHSGARDNYDYSAHNHNNIQYHSTTPSAPTILPLIQAGASGNTYGSYSSGSRSNYEVSSSSNMAELQRQLQEDLSRQLQAALVKNKQYMQQYSTASDSNYYNNPQAYERSYNRLYEELNRNLTRQLEDFETSQSYSSHGSFNDAQLANLKSQLQRNLASQLQQGLTQSYSASASYSASSSSHSGTSGSYRPVRAFENYANGYGQFRSGNTPVGQDPADCDHY
ncbi:uncharacterized protein LOC132701250 [Cylas formicarius]|uniref:uncharacterized protein LOC132701250 n=1 Tax=Cylas formicarius TaxID=197179 RepID=UPI002958752B|nr:uncharacterized protein LOC132701250 [Cylas formicarius]